MTDPVKQALYTALAAAWLGIFGFEAGAIAHGTLSLHGSQSRGDALGDRLRATSIDIVELFRQTRDQTREIDFLQGLVNVLPQEKSFIRTQRAMAEEVDVLREKVGSRVRNDLHILVDTKANKLYLKRGLTLLWQADCSVGRGGVLKDKVTGRRWEFVTPRGQFEVLSKIENPFWTKPDWAFVENGETVPPLEDPKRRVPGELGAYVFNLGDGYLIHGTKTEALLGRPVSHGCVRLGAEDLKKLFETVPRGVRVYIY